MKALQGLILGGAVGGSSSLSICFSLSNSNHGPIPTRHSATMRMVEPGGTVDFQTQTARAYYERRREALGAWTEERRGRDSCPRCRRARKMCLCSSLPAHALPTSTRFVILQHPAETKKRITGTVPLVLHCLSNCHRVVMRSDYGESDLRNVLGVGGSRRGGGGGSSEGEGANGGSSGDTSSPILEGGANVPLLLFPCPDSEYLEDIATERDRVLTSASPTPSTTTPSSTSSAPPPPPPSAPPPGAVVVLVDGTWSQAKQILSRYPFLTRQKPSVAGPGGRGLRFTSDGGAPAASSGTTAANYEAGMFAPDGGGDAARDGERRGDWRSGGALCRAVKFRSAGVSSYGFRREPTKECLSTLESVAYTLEVLEGTPEGLAAAAHLRKAFSAMVAMQLEAAEAAGGRPRFVDRKGRTANRRSTPPKK